MNREEVEDCLEEVRKSDKVLVVSGEAPPRDLSDRPTTVDWYINYVDGEWVARRKTGTVDQVEYEDLIQGVPNAYDDHSLVEEDPVFWDKEEFRKKSGEGDR